MPLRTMSASATENAKSPTPGPLKPPEKGHGSPAEPASAPTPTEGPTRAQAPATEPPVATASEEPELRFFVAGSRTTARNSAYARAAMKKPEPLVLDGATVGATVFWNPRPAAAGTTQADPSGMRLDGTKRLYTGYGVEVPAGYQAVYVSSPTVSSAAPVLTLPPGRHDVDFPLPVTGTGRQVSAGEPIATVYLQRLTPVTLVVEGDSA